MNLVLGRRRRWPWPRLRLRRRSRGAPGPELLVQGVESVEDRLAIEHDYAYDSAPSQMNTPRRANEIGLSASAPA